MAFLSASEGGGVLGGPLADGECGSPQNLYQSGRRRSRRWLLLEAGPVSKQPVGDVLGKALGEHRLADLRRRDFLPEHLPTNGFTDQADLVALAEGLWAGEHVDVSGVCGVEERTGADRGDVPLVDRRGGPVAVGALYLAARADLRHPGQAVGGIVRAAQEGPRQARGAGRVLDRPEAVGEPLIPAAVLHRRCRQDDDPLRALLGRQFQQLRGGCPGGGISEGAWADEDRLDVAQSLRQRL